MAEIKSKQDEITALLKSLESDSRISNEPVLVTNQDELMRGRNGGYPVHLFHPTLAPVIATNRKQETAVAAEGYVRNYIHKSYPKWLYRRNPDAKFASADYIEARTVPNAEAEAALLKLRKPADCSQWAERVTDVEPLAAGPNEDPAVTIARLEGAVAELREAQARKK